jgi:hypothetical protein
MQSGSSGLLESLAAGLLCVVVLAAVYRKDRDGHVCQTERVAIVHQPAAIPLQPMDPRMEADIKDMRLHD